jgi:hypothetical protein
MRPSSNPSTTKIIKIKNKINTICKCKILKEKSYARHRWLMPVILATQEAEIRGITV